MEMRRFGALLGDPCLLHDRRTAGVMPSGERRDLMDKMQKVAVGVALVVGVMTAGAMPASAEDGTPANNGCGMAFGAEVSGAAQALGGFGSEAGPPTHQGLHGVKGDFCGS